MDHLSLVEFTYNNNYQAIIGKVPYEALYEKRCCTPLCREEVGERKLLRSELVRVTLEKVRMIKDRMKGVQDRQKSYVDNKKRLLEFKVGDPVFLKVAL